jgi:hypothetical protein
MRMTGRHALLLPQLPAHVAPATSPVVSVCSLIRAVNSCIATSWELLAASWLRNTSNSSKSATEGRIRGVAICRAWCSRIPSVRALHPLSLQRWSGCLSRREEFAQAHIALERVRQAMRRDRRASARAHSYEAGDLPQVLRRASAPKDSFVYPMSRQSLHACSSLTRFPRPDSQAPSSLAWTIQSG